MKFPAGHTYTNGELTLFIYLFISPFFLVRFIRCLPASQLLPYSWDHSWLCFFYTYSRSLPACLRQLIPYTVFSSLFPSSVFWKVIAVQHDWNESIQLRTNPSPALQLVVTTVFAASKQTAVNLHQVTITPAYSARGCLHSTIVSICIIYKVWVERTASKAPTAECSLDKRSHTVQNQ